MKYFVLLVVVGICLAFDKESMLKHNKIGKEAVGSIDIPSACEQCQSFVHRLSNAMKDPQKLVELEAMLSAFCTETSYVDECRQFVLELDVIAKILEPHLQDAQRVCNVINMCSNSRLETFRRIGQLYAKSTMSNADGITDFICDECQFVTRELKNYFEDKAKEQEIRDFLLQNVCKYMARLQDTCNKFAEEFVHELFQEFDTMLKDPKAACIDIGFCPRSNYSRKLVGFIGFLSRL